MRVKAAKKILEFENRTLLARLKGATNSVNSLVKHARGSIASQQLRQHPTAPRSLVKSTLKQNIFVSASRAQPRPLSTYPHTASLGVEDILPHLLRNERHGSASAPDRTSSNISFADVSLVRDTIACRRTQILAELGAMPTDTVWFMLFPLEVRPGIRLSKSSTVGSTACIFSTVLGYFACKYDAACLIFLEDNFRAAQSLSTSGCFEVQSLRSDIACFPVTDPQPSGGPYTAAGNREQRSAKAPEASLHVPDPKLQLLERYGVMCGEHQRVPILEAVPYIMRGLLLRYHRQLPLAVWRLICLQFIQEMQRSADAMSPASAGCKVSQHERGEWPDECPWAHVQEVAGEIVKLCIRTFREAYNQSFACRGLQLQSRGEFEALMSHEQVVERLQEDSCSTAMNASMIISDATFTYRAFLGNHDDILARVMVRSHIFSPDIEYSVPQLLMNTTDTERTVLVVPMHCHITRNIVTSVTTLNTSNSPDRMHTGRFSA